VFLAESRTHVHVLIRCPLSDTMSIPDSSHRGQPEHWLHIHTELVVLEGKEQLARVTWRQNESGAEEERDIRHVFPMTGATEHAWLDRCVALTRSDSSKRS
jgi:hypothetical protein